MLTIHKRAGHERAPAAAEGAARVAAADQGAARSLAAGSASGTTLVDRRRVYHYGSSAVRQLEATKHRCHEQERRLKALEADFQQKAQQLSSLIEHTVDAGRENGALESIIQKRQRDLERIVAEGRRIEGLVAGADEQNDAAAKMLARADADRRRAEELLAELRAASDAQLLGLSPRRAGEARLLASARRVQEAIEMASEDYDSLLFEAAAVQEEHDRTCAAVGQAEARAREAQARHDRDVAEHGAVLQAQDESRGRARTLQESTARASAHLERVERDIADLELRASRSLGALGRQAAALAAERALREKAALGLQRALREQREENGSAKESASSASRRLRDALQMLSAEQEARALLERSVAGEAGELRRQQQLLRESAGRRDALQKEHTDRLVTYHVSIHELGRLRCEAKEMELLAAKRGAEQRQLRGASEARARDARRAAERAEEERACAEAKASAEETAMASESDALRRLGEVAADLAREAEALRGSIAGLRRQQRDAEATSLGALAKKKRSEYHMERSRREERARRAKEREEKLAFERERLLQELRAVPPEQERCMQKLRVLADTFDAKSRDHTEALAEAPAPAPEPKAPRPKSAAARPRSRGRSRARAEPAKRASSAPAAQRRRDRLQQLPSYSAAAKGAAPAPTPRPKVLRRRKAKSSASDSWFQDDGFGW